MKTFAIFLVMSSIAVFRTQPAAIELIGGFCCDENSVAQCKVWPFEPIGNPCWCPGMRPDSGHVCL